MKEGKRNHFHYIPAQSSSGSFVPRPCLQALPFPSLFTTLDMLSFSAMALLHRPFKSKLHPQTPHLTACLWKVLTRISKLKSIQIV